MTEGTMLRVSRDQLMAVDLAAVRALCGERAFAEAQRIAAYGFGSATRDGLTLEANLSIAQGRLVTTRVAFEFSRLDVRCSCRSNERFCEHVGALLILSVRRPDLFTQKGPTAASYNLQRTWAKGRGSLPRRPVHDVPYELGVLLSGLRVPELRSLAQRLDIRLRGSAKSDIVDQLVAALSDPAHVARILGALGPDLGLALAAVYALVVGEGAGQRQVKAGLNRLAASGASGDALLGGLQALRLVFEPVDLPGSGRYLVPVAYWSQIPTIEAVERLGEPNGPTQPAGCLADLLLPIWSDIRDGKLSLVARQATMPDFVGRAYPQLQDPGYVREEVEALVRSDKWASDALDLTIPRRTPLLSDEGMRALGERVGGVEQAGFAWSLLGVLGLVESGEAITAPDDTARELLWQGPLERLGTVVEAWLNIAGWSELDLALALNPSLRLRRRLKIGPASYYSERLDQEDLDAAVTEGRQFALRIVSLLPVGDWLRIESLLNVVWRIWPDSFAGEKGRGSKSEWWLEVDGRRVDSGRFPDWVRGPGAVVAALISGPLHWLGFADIAGPADHPTAFRLRPAARLLRGDDLREETAPAPVELGPDLDVRVAAGHPDRELREALTKAARLLETSASGFRYRLAPEGVLSLFESGRSADDLLAILERRAAAVPTDLRATIERWWQSYTQLRLAEGLTLVELSDDQLLEELLIATSLRQHLIHSFTPRLLAVDPAGADELFAELRGRGYMPRIEPLDAVAPADGAGPAEDAR